MCVCVGIHCSGALASCSSAQPVTPSLLFEHRAKLCLVFHTPRYSKGLLSEILDFVMGTGLIPADGEVGVCVRSWFYCLSVQPWVLAPPREGGTCLIPADGEVRCTE